MQLGLKTEMRGNTWVPWLKTGSFWITGYFASHKSIILICVISKICLNILSEDVKFTLLYDFRLIGVCVCINPLTSRPGCIPGSRYTCVRVLFFVI